jgi:hypothetical protein
MNSLYTPKIMKIAENKRKTRSPKISRYRDIVKKCDKLLYKISGETHPYNVT